MFSNALLFSVLATLSYAFPAAEPQELNPPNPPIVPEWATIDNVTFTGTGCPQGSTQATISGDKTVVHLGFDSYQAFKDPWSRNFQDQTKQCNVNLKINYPNGYSVTVGTTDIRGFADLDGSCTGTVAGKFWWSGKQQEMKASIQSPIEGPFLGDFTQTVSVPSSQFVWSQCNANGPLFNINTRILATCNDPADGAYIQVESQDTAIKTPFVWDLNLIWARC